MATALKRKAAAAAKPTSGLPPVERLKLGVYTSHNRESAVAINRTPQGVWYLTMQPGYVRLMHASDERFARTFPLVLADYPIRRAVRKYAESGLSIAEDAERVMKKLLEQL